MVDNKKLMEMHSAGFNCSQCVACAFSDRTGLDEKTTLAVSGGLGGGFKVGDICGAASGAVLVLGMLTPHVNPNAPEEKARITARTVEFMKRFQEAYGYIDCRDLKGKGKIPCDELIRGGAAILDEMLSEEEK